MKQTIKHAALATTLLLAVAVAGHAADNKQDESYGTETRTVAAFSNINLIGPFHVIVTAQGANAIELSGPRRQLAEIETSGQRRHPDRAPAAARTKAGAQLQLGQERRPLTVRISAAR
jgi:hypothetical protein